MRRVQGDSAGQQVSENTERTGAGAQVGVELHTGLEVLPLEREQRNHDGSALLNTMPRWSQYV